ncbi:MAG: 3-deoxy-manno-octulosonate cytidylyltransferase [Bacteroidetes bacterium]|jgi:3-deoxy-manno-octulosonate cytidylyltransferase (CMP-KDO synthetase)|nr:3-deoxy-manno-octulosonate cytidylyltransferase [Bacteroidota bacterium]
MRIIAIIPARYASSRFPGKPLADIQGMTMIQRVYEQVQKSKKIDQVIVATDDERIFDTVASFGGKAVMTADTHPSGTDRCFEALDKTAGHFDAVLNIQGDEPFIDPLQIDQLAELIQSPKVDIATLITPIIDTAILFDPNVVKVVRSITGRALYFSRQAIPYLRNSKADEWPEAHLFYRHLGIYAFKSEILKAVTAIAPSKLEMAESLEQLRWLENGYYIQTGVTQHEGISVDTPEDLKKLINKI